jgi:hypothetical protein
LTWVNGRRRHGKQEIKNNTDDTDWGTDYTERETDAIDL